MQKGFLVIENPAYWCGKSDTFSVLTQRCWYGVRKVIRSLKNSCSRQSTEASVGQSGLICSNHGKISQKNKSCDVCLSECGCGKSGFNVQQCVQLFFIVPRTKRQMMATGRFPSLLHSWSWLPTSL